MISHWGVNSALDGRNLSFPSNHCALECIVIANVARVRLRRKTHASELLDTCSSLYICSTRPRK